MGCVAWLTNESILKALATRKLVQIIIQKEDFLRPDSDNWTSYKLKKLYHALPNGLRIPTYHGWLTDTFLDSVCTGSDLGNFDAIRWAGEFNTLQSKAFPRMHNKFLVFCDFNDETINPLAVWTGSFNMTHNGCNSLENGLFIKDTNIVLAYYRQWAEIVGISEPLDWRLTWEYELRIGT